jgi:hypothetical protein
MILSQIVIAQLPSYLSPAPTVLIMHIAFNSTGNRIFDAVLITCLNTSVWVSMEEVIKISSALITARAVQNIFMAGVLKRRLDDRLQTFFDDVASFRRQVGHLDLILYGSALYGLLFPEKPLDFADPCSNLNILCRYQSFPGITDYLMNSGYTPIDEPSELCINDRANVTVYYFLIEKGNSPILTFSINELLPVFSSRNKDVR